MTDREIAIAHEAFMIGRIYSNMGEKEKPAEIHRKLMERCENIANSFPSDELKYKRRNRLKYFLFGFVECTFIFILYKLIGDLF